MNRNLRYQVLRILIHLIGVLPGLSLVWLYTNGDLGINPVQEATQRSGNYAIALLTASLACTPVHIIFGLSDILRVRRTLGLYAFGYALVHLLLFVGVDYGFNLQFLKSVFVEKRYIFAGMAALTLLIPLAITSSKWFQRRMGKNWKRLHRLVYVAGILVVIHYAWVVKGNVSALQGDILMPLFYIVLMSFLLLVRVKPVRQWIINQRSVKKRRGEVSIVKSSHISE